MKYIIFVRHSATEGYTIFGQTDDRAKARQSWVDACMSSPIELPILAKRLNMIVDWEEKDE